MKTIFIIICLIFINIVLFTCVVDWCPVVHIVFGLEEVVFGLGPNKVPGGRVTARELGRGRHHDDRRGRAAHQRGQLLQHVYFQPWSPFPEDKNNQQNLILAKLN